MNADLNTNEKNDNSPRPRRDNPYQEEEQQGIEQPWQAPGVEREYQGDSPEEKRAPGEEQQDPTDERDRKIA